MAKQIRMTSAEARKSARVDRAKLEATTEADIARHAAEDGSDSADLTFSPVVPAAAVRAKLGLSQEAFAQLIGVPVGTVRNWEQERVTPDPAARTLLLILYRQPKLAMKALQVA